VVTVKNYVKTIEVEYIPEFSASLPMQTPISIPFALDVESIKAADKHVKLCFTTTFRQIDSFDTNLKQT
jgi:hypothetical protein